MRRALLVTSTLCALLVLGGSMPADTAPLEHGAVIFVADRTPVEAQFERSRTWWQRRIDRMVGSHSMGVAVRLEGNPLYDHAETIKRIPASNEKLLLSMAILNRLPTDYTIETDVSTTSELNGPVINGDLWILGHGDPTVSGGGKYGRSLPFTPTRIATLARQIAGTGVTHVTGSVIGSTGYFSHDWFAPGWKSSFPKDEVALPSALTFEGNTRHGDHISNPEFLAATSLTNKLKDLGVRVSGDASSGSAPQGLIDVASVTSKPLPKIMRFMNRNSVNFFAEMLGKLLGAKVAGPPGTIAKGADAIESFAGSLNVRIVANDSSGLSYDDRVSPNGMVRLLTYADQQPWGNALRSTLPGADQGTLKNRLKGVRLRAKTGTLDRISALSGWVWLRKADAWAEFSIISKGMDKTQAAGIENNIVRLLTRAAH